MQPNTDSDWHDAYSWLCQRRKNAPANADVWHLRWKWPQESEVLYSLVVNGHYRLSPMLILAHGKQASATWSSADALVLKWVALKIQRLLPQPKGCMHLKGRGVKKSVSQVAHALSSGQYAFVRRTDIRGYYEHIRKTQVMNHLRPFIQDTVLLGILYEYVDYLVEKNGEIHAGSGIPRGCAISPIIGASLLRHIDAAFTTDNEQQVFYARYMDDFLLLTDTRWRLRKVIAQLGCKLEQSGFERHPEKTQTGRIFRDFDWLGINFGAEGPALSPRALNHHHERRLRLLEQA